MKELKRKKWKKPNLTVLFKSNQEHRVFSPCQYTTAWGPNNVHGGCWFQDNGNHSCSGGCVDDHVCI